MDTRSPAPRSLRPAAGGERAAHRRRSVRALYLLALVLAVAAVGWFARERPLALFSIYSRSMAPLLRPGDELVALSVPFWRIELERGMLVAFVRPVVPRQHELVVKRVVALPGDEVAIRRGSVYVNGEAVREPPPEHAEIDLADGFGPYRLPAGSVFVLGDNAEVSEDSAVFGPIDMRRIRFAIWLRHAPADRRCSFRAPRWLPPCETGTGSGRAGVTVPPAGGQGKA